MTKNTCALITILLLSAVGIYGQHAKRQTSETPAPSSYDLQQSYSKIKAKAKTTGDALVSGDFNTVADHTYPKVVRLMGGRENMISATAQEMRTLERKGFTVKSVSVLEPNKVEIIGKQIFSIVPMTMTMTVPSGTMLVESFLIAVSEDRGKTWTFVDGTAAGDKRMLRQIFPFAADKLHLPARKQPVIYPNDRSRG